MASVSGAGTGNPAPARSDLVGRDDHWLSILRSNQGFSDPHRWIDYARQHNFTAIRADKLTNCPDCNAAAWKKLGQFIYYSTLITLNTCANCGLVFSDTRIDAQVMQRHFEDAYKDEDYFLVTRRDISGQIACLVDRHAPKGGKVIDVGGAKGHLMAAVNRRRPDLKLVVNDLSSASCAWAASHYHFETITGSARDLDQVRDRFDVVTMIDVIYYEPGISKLWQCLATLVADRGVLIIRLPNTLTSISVHESLTRLVTGRRASEMRTRIRYFNPEHLFLFSRRYLTRRLKGLGFADIAFIPSALLIANETLRSVCRLYFRSAKLAHALSFGRLITTPSVVVVARRRCDGEPVKP